MKIKYVGRRPFHAVSLGHEKYVFNRENNQTCTVPDESYMLFLRNAEDASAYMPVMDEIITRNICPECQKVKDKKDKKKKEKD